MNIEPQLWEQIRRAMTGWVLPLNEEVLEEIPDPHFGSAEYDDLYEAIHKLPPEYRACLELVYFQQFSHWQAAKQLSITTKQVAENVKEAIAQLMELLGSGDRRS